MPTPPSTDSTVDLTVSGNFGTVGTTVFTAEQTNAGTGTFPAFLSLANSNTEQAYNSDFRPVQTGFHATSNANHNHSLLLANIPIVEGDGTGGTTEGVLYREFLLDANESGNGDARFLSLDELQIWQEEAGDLTGFTPDAGFIGLHTNYLAYDLDAGGDAWIAIDASLSAGSGKSDIRVLIPDTEFDPSVPFVYLYSAFGLQGDGWSSNSGSEEWGVRNGQSGPGGGSKAALNISKTAAVDGNTADTAGEIITYSMTLANTGNLNLTGITVTDPSVFDLTRGLDQVGNNDLVLNVGEIWTYTAHHTVTQEEIDSAAQSGARTLDNTVSAGSDQTGHLPEQLDTASTAIPIEARPIVALDKTVTSITSTDAAVGTTEADAAGDIINYTVSVAWGTNGNTTLNNPVVSDESIIVNEIVDPSAPVPNTGAQVFVPIFDGDTNLGDNNNNGIVDPTDANGVRDPGETFQYVYIGDTNQDGFHDPGETWVAYNLSDTDQNGTRNGLEAQFVGDANNDSVEDVGEKWQFQNVWDVNDNGLQDNGEAWQYQNVSDFNQNGTEDPGETFQYYNIGDTNQNSTEDPGETFQFYNAGDTDRDGVEDMGETFQFNHVLPGVDVNDDGFNDGDLNFDGKINATETWLYTASYTVTQDDIDNRVDGVPTFVEGLTHDNTASVVTNENATANDSVSVVIDQNPHLSVTKTASIPDTTTAGDPTPDDGKIDSPADDITYTITLLNDGNMTLTGINVNDSLAGLLTTHTETGGDPETNGDGELNVGETWTFTTIYDTQQSDIDNRGAVDGSNDPQDNIHNLVTVTTAQNIVVGNEVQNVGGSDTEDVEIDYRPSLSISKTASIPDSDNDGKIDSPDDDITYTIVVTNDGNVTLTGVDTNDSIVGPLTSHTDSGAGTHGDNVLDVGETWTYTAVYDTQQSDIDDRGNVDGTDDDNIHNLAAVTTAQGAGGSDDADVAIDYRPSLSVSKTASIPDSDNDGKIDSPADDITYTIVVENDGNVTLTGVDVNDSISGALTSHSETGGTGTNGDGVLDVGETWTFTSVYDTQQSDIDNQGSVDGTPDNNIHNDVTVATTQGAGGSDTADVGIDYNPNFTFTVTTLGYHDNDESGTANTGDTVDFSTFFTNTGNVTLTNVAISSEDGLIAWSGPIASLAPGGTDATTITGTHLIQGGAGFEETEIGQSDQVGNILVPVDVVYADLTPIPDSFAPANMQVIDQAWGMM